MKIIQGQENIKIELMAFLKQHTGSSFRSIVTQVPLVYALGEDFAEYFMQDRVRRGVHLKSLRLTQECFDIKKHKNYRGYLKDVRHVETDSNLGSDVVFIGKDSILLFDIEKLECRIVYDSEAREYFSQMFNSLWK